MSSSGEDLSQVCFRDVSWLQAFELTNASVMEYFSYSQFYERTSNNEVLKMQARYINKPEEMLSQLQCNQRFALTCVLVR